MRQQGKSLSAPVLNAKLIATALLFFSFAASAAADDLLDLSLEQLLSVEVTSAARKSQSLSETAAAVYVISDEAIRASGARSIPEALRLAPGLHVAQIDANRWAVSSRGFNGRFSNKLLVMVDGRSVYTPSFAGVYWESLDTLIDDIDRIEVIRGPGSSVWGANAVNGVINIITKKSLLTQGLLFSADADSLGGTTAGLRIGSQVSENSHLRLFLKSTSRDAGEDIFGTETNDHFQSLRVGGRYDLESGRNAFSIAAEINDDELGESLTASTLVPPYWNRMSADSNVSGFFVNAEWQRRLQSNGEFSIRAFVNDIDRDGILFGERSKTFDLDAQWTLPQFGRHELMFGVGLRRYDFEFDQSEFVGIQQLDGSDNSISAFIQDEIRFADDAGRLTLGIKLERDQRLSNDVKVMPTMRASFKTSRSATIWGSITRSIRTPSYADSDLSIAGIGGAIPPMTALNPLPIPMINAYSGSQRVSDESVVALESGIRWQIDESRSLDIATFYNRYDDLRYATSLETRCEPGGASPQIDPTCLFQSTHVSNTLHFANLLRADSYGLEISGRWSPTDNVRLEGNYSFHDVDFDGAQTFGIEPFFAYSRNLLSLRGDWSFASRMNLALWARYTGGLTGQPVKAHHDLSLRWSWRPTDGLEVSLVGERLSDGDRVEFLSELQDSPATRIERRFVAQLRWLF